MALFECRGYEQVTPSFKGGAALTNEPPGFNVAGVTSISPSGASLAVGSLNVLAGAGSDVAEGPHTTYLMTRGAEAWTTTSLTPPASQFGYAEEELRSSDELETGVWVARPVAPEAERPGLYLREADGAFHEIGPIAPTELSASLDEVEGASQDRSRVLFRIPGANNSTEPDPLWPGDQTVGEELGLSSLYEYVGTGHTGEGGDVPGLVGVDNGGAQITQCGTALGAHRGVTTQNEVPGAVSDAGTTVFFNAEAGECAPEAAGPPVAQLYARVGTPGSGQVTVNVAGTAECDVSVACNVTSRPTFSGASRNGSRVFFTTEQPLLPADADFGNDIYECELPGDGGRTPTASSEVVNACPDLKAVSVTGTSEGAEVRSVVAVSQEGSDVYFIAGGVLTTAPNDQGHAAEPGANNLYAWEAPTATYPNGHTSFIGVLPEEETEHVQLTPDGRYFVLQTEGDLTNDDTSTVAQVFRYDAANEELVRISTGQEGFNADGNTEIDPATIARGAYGRLTVSADGSYVAFQSDDALTPSVHGGIHNTYLWHNGAIRLISDGTDASEAAGLIGMNAAATNIFFTTQDPLVAGDEGTAVDVYDARIDGGFPAPLEPKCEGEACQGNLIVAPATEIHGGSGVAIDGNLALSDLHLPGEAATATPTHKHPLTRVQRLKKALQRCHRDKARGRRRGCERAAHRRYGVKKKGNRKK
ncbi:MAG TPA: hypothetical protein VIJ66_00265 [Solirubrobacteraceae bacterium]